MSIERPQTPGLKVFSSAIDCEAVTPDDDTEIVFHALYVGTGGDVSIKTATDGAAVTFANVPDGSILPVAGIRVMAATGASDIVALRW